MSNLSLSLSLCRPLSTHLLRALRTLYLIPLELSRLASRSTYARQHLNALQAFVTYMYKSDSEAER